MIKDEFEILRDLMIWRRGYETYTYIVLVNVALVAFAFQYSFIAYLAIAQFIFLFSSASKPRFKDPQKIKNCSNYILLNDILKEFIHNWIILIVGLITMLLINSCMRKFSKSRLITIALGFDICMYITKKYSSFELRTNMYWLKELICKEFECLKWFSLTPGHLTSKPIIQQIDYIDELDYYELMRFQACILQSILQFEFYKNITIKANIEKKVKNTLNTLWIQKSGYNEKIIQNKKNKMPHIYSIEIDRQGREAFLLKHLPNVVADIIKNETNYNIDELIENIEFEVDSIAKMPMPETIYNEMDCLMQSFNSQKEIKNNKRIKVCNNHRHSNSFENKEIKEKLTNDELADGKWMNEITDPRLQHNKEKTKASKEKAVEEQKYQAPKYSGIEKSEKQRRIEEKRRIKKMMEADEKKRLERERLAKLEEAERARHAKQDEERRKKLEQEEEERRKKHEEEEKRRQEEKEARLLQESIKSKSDINDDNFDTAIEHLSEVVIENYTEDNNIHLHDCHDTDMSSSSQDFPNPPEDHIGETEHHHASRWRKSRSDDEPRKPRARRIHEHEFNQIAPISIPQTQAAQQIPPQPAQQYIFPQAQYPQTIVSDYQGYITTQQYQQYTYMDQQTYTQLPQQQIYTTQQPVTQPPQPQQRHLGSGLFNLDLDALRRRRKRRTDVAAEALASAPVMPQPPQDVIQVEPWVAEPVGGYSAQPQSYVNYDVPDYSTQLQQPSLDELARPRRRKRNPM